MFITKILIFAAILSLVAEGQTDRQSRCELRVSVRNFSSQPLHASLLLIGTGQFSRTTQTDTFGEADFLGLPADDYTLFVRAASSNGIEEQERLSTRNGDCVQSEMVRLNVPNERLSGAEVFVGDLKAPAAANELYRMGVGELRQQRWRDAQQSFAKAVEAYQEFAAAYNGLGVAASENGEFDIANSAFRDALRHRMYYVEAKLNFAKSLIRQQKFGQAESLLNDVLASDPRNSSAIFLLAESLFGRQDFDAVLALTRKVDGSHYSHNPLIHQFTAEIYRQRGMTQKAEGENKVIAAESRHP